MSAGNVAPGCAQDVSYVFTALYYFCYYSYEYAMEQTDFLLANAILATARVTEATVNLDC